MKSGLKLGALGVEVQRLHRALTAAGHKIEPAELERNEFGPSTRDALREFQRNLGLDEHGETDEPTCEALLEIEKNITINIYEGGYCPLNLPPYPTAKLRLTAHSSIRTGHPLLTCLRASEPTQLKL